MDFRCVKLLLALLAAERIWSLPSGCRHNGTSYTEGEVVQAGEPCLSCLCQRGALACSLRVCADYLEALPPGCFLVHKPNDCCPQLFCEGGSSPNGIELRTARTESKVGCVINGTAYGEGSAVASQDPCEYCYCAEGGLKCVRPRCVQSFEGCTAVYERSSCCPTHFDCRDAKVSFFTSRVKHFDNLSSNLSKDPLRSLEDADVEPETENSKISESSTASEEKTTEDFAAVTTEETTQGTTLDPQPETTTPTSADSPTTLDFQTTEDGGQGKESPAVGVTEETTPEVTSHASSEPEKDGEEEPEVEGRNPLEAAETVGWNSSQVADDYDSYDYGEPKLPPSLPNLVIFPFVAADAVVKDERAELYEETQLDRIDDQPVVFKDYFSPPTRTEGGFVPKQPSPQPFYELPFVRKEPTDPPPEGNQTPMQTNASPKAPNEPNFPFDDDQRTDLFSEGIFRGDSKGPSSGPLNEVLQEEAAPGFFSKEVLDRKSQQTKKPVTVTYKNVVVDFYPNYLVTTTRSRSTTPSGGNPATEPQKTTTTSAPDPGFDFFDEATALPTVELPAEFTTHEATPSSTNRESSFFEQFLKTFLTEANTSTMTPLTSAKHKYSSKIKSVLTTTAKPKGQKDAVRLDVTPTSSSPPTKSGLPAVLHFTDRPEPVKEAINPLTEPVPPPFGDPQDENKLSEPASHGPDGPTPPDKTHPNPATLLKLAGCNIYGMMYRIGKVITELSGPCVECLCTDFGVQCSPLDC